MWSTVERAQKCLLIICERLVEASLWNDRLDEMFSMRFWFLDPLAVMVNEEVVLQKQGAGVRAAQQLRAGDAVVAPRSS